MNGTMRLLGQMLSMGIASMIFAIVIGRVEITPAFYPQFVISVHYTFILFTILCHCRDLRFVCEGKRTLI